MKKTINKHGQAIVKILAEQRETLERIEKQIDFMSEGVKAMREDIKQMRPKIHKKILAKKHFAFQHCVTTRRLTGCNPEF